MLLFLDPNTDVKTVFSKNEIARVEGLGAARRGDSSQLHVEAISLDSQTGVLIKQLQNEEQAFVAVIPVQKTDKDLRKNADLGITGQIALGEPFLIPACESGEYFYKSQFKVQTALIELKLCDTREAGETTGYQLVESAVTDSSPKLAPEQQKTVVIGASQIDRIQHGKEPNPGAKVKFTNTHHNACEQLLIDVGFAAYAFTTPPIAGCFNPEFNPIPEAPARNLFNDPNRSEVFYKTRYLNEPWSEVSNLGCGHYMFFCVTKPNP